MASDFLMQRKNGSAGLLPAVDAVAAFPTIEFGEAVEGPLAIGYGAHFGLGRFEPLR